MSYTCLVGPGALDAVAYARNKTGDTDPTNFLIPDSAYQEYVAVAAQDISRFLPLEPQIVGNIYNNTSPLVTAKGVMRYLCNAANGFTYPVRKVTDVLYRASSGYSASTDIGYMALLPFSPVNAFLFTPSLIDSPSQRYLRDEYLNELDHYGVGQAGISLDPSGSYALDLYPIPTSDGLPVFVKYETSHADTGVNGSSVYATVPDHTARLFAKLVYAEVLDNEAFTLLDAGNATAGLLKVSGDPEGLIRYAQRLKDDIYIELGVAQGVADVSN